MIKPKGFIIPTSLLGVIAERPDILVALLLLSHEQCSKVVKVTFDELAIACGYKNRSGAWKAINKLQAQGVVTKYGRGIIKINIPVVV